jgi:hypothetical protein
MTEFEYKCYGMSEAEVRDEYMNSVTARLSGLEMVVMGVLSDCQEMLNYTNDVSYKASEESVRKQMNIAKFILSEMMKAKEEEQDLRARYAKRKAEIAKDKRYGGFTV